MYCVAYKERVIKVTHFRFYGLLRFFIFVLLEPQMLRSEGVINNMKGIVKFYNDMKGFGFITGEDGKETFVHRSSIPVELNLREGDEVEYQIEDSERGTRATNLKK